MDSVITTDPRQWSIVPNAKEMAKPRKRKTAPIWIRSEYIGIGDATYEFLGKPRYVQFRRQGNDLVIIPCGARDSGSRKIQKPKAPRSFFHLRGWHFSSRYRSGDYHEIKYRHVGREPYICLTGVVL